MIFQQRCSLCYILLTDEISLPDCLSFLRYFHIFIFIYLLIYFANTNIYKKNTSYKFKQKYVCRGPLENQNMFWHQAPLNIMSVINFWSLLYDPRAENTHYRGHRYLNLKLNIIISSIHF